MEPFATLQDLEVSWPAINESQREDAPQKLVEASLIIRALKPDIDALILVELMDPDLPKMVVCGMVKRALKTPDAGEGIGTQQQTAGPFSQSFTYTNPDGNLYLSKLDKRILGIGAAQAFTVDLMGDS
ncbi:hypothetical protein ART_1611 [Arthrobacter sp. PAMC 25486]|uniref:Gp19/Gp15/Gp42 family protein n=1 Tax=Arthrobacter sp. PAMC 25486 TaxID=1494608 RepID=UPI000535BC20|nr:Gp19/Gp15/Gp42 family protein [Arthrobacter sp. PAMC 25486]AIY01210.1 hypothetical protein ART_1611 [Arthrobacter sp. PAMC 25486]